MASSLSVRTQRRTPSTLDISTLTSNYGLDASKPAVVASKLSTDEDEYDLPDEPEIVRGVFELRSDGSCEHYSVDAKGELKLSAEPKLFSP